MPSDERIAPDGTRSADTVRKSLFKAQTLRYGASTTTSAINTVPIDMSFAEHHDRARFVSEEEFRRKFNKQKKSSETSMTLGGKSGAEGGAQDGAGDGSGDNGDGGDDHSGGRRGSDAAGAGFGLGRSSMRASTASERQSGVVIQEAKSLRSAAEIAEGRHSHTHSSRSKGSASPRSSRSGSLARSEHAPTTNGSYADCQSEDEEVKSAVSAGSAKSSPRHSDMIDDRRNPRLSSATPIYHTRDLRGYSAAAPPPTVKLSNDSIRSPVTTSLTPDAGTRRTFRNSANATTGGRQVSPFIPQSTSSSSSSTTSNEHALTPSVVKTHCTAQSCWIIVQGNVYDVTGFLSQHPGGTTAILQQGGRDATQTVMSVHSNPTGVLQDIVARCKTANGGIKYLGRLQREE